MNSQSSLLEEYIDSKRHKWSETTIKSVRAQLNNVDLNATPNKVMDAFAGSSMYSAKTLFIRLGDFKAFQIERGFAQGPNEFKKFMEHNYKFKNAYKKEELSITRTDAASRLSGISCPSAQSWARYLLSTGLRLSEIYTVSLAGLYWEVLGKQGKIRKVFLAPPNVAPPKKYTLQRELSKVGLTPKMLRKLFATSLDQNKVGLKDLMKIMGWSSVQTADSYLQGSNDEKLKEIVNGN